MKYFYSHYLFEIYLSRVTRAATEKPAAVERFGALVAPAMMGFDSPAHKHGGSKATATPIPEELTLFFLLGTRHTRDAHAGKTRKHTQKILLLFLCFCFVFRNRVSL